MRIRVLLLFVFTAITIKAFCQYEGVEICLTKNSFVIDENRRITLFYNNSSNSYFAGVKYWPYIDENDISSFSPTKADTLFTISKIDFNRIVELCLGLSSLNILSGMNTQETTVVNDPNSITLTIWANYESVRYDFLLPIDNARERHLQQFVVLCKEIINTTDLSVNSFLK